MAHFRIQELIEESKNTGKKVTQTGLAKAAGISQASMWAIVQGKTKAPDPQILLAIAGVFTEALGREVTIDDLIDKDGSTEKPESTQHPITPPEPQSIEDKIDHLSQQMASVRGEIGDMRQDINQQMAEIRDAISK